MQSNKRALRGRSKQQTTGKSTLLSSNNFIESLNYNATVEGKLFYKCHYKHSLIAAQLLVGVGGKGEETGNMVVYIYYPIYS